MARSEYKGFMIITQVADWNGIPMWRYKIYMCQPLTDYPSEFAYSTSQEAEAAARRHIDNIPTVSHEYPK